MFFEDDSSYFTESWPLLLVYAVGFLLLLILHKKTRFLGGCKNNNNNKPAVLQCGCDCKVCNLRPTVTRLFTDHYVWTRQVIVSAFAHLEDLPFVLARLKLNQTDIALAISGRFEKTPGVIYKVQKQLWDEHIDGAVAIVTAIIENDPEKQEKETAKWYENADQIAASLTALQPSVWPLDVTTGLMKMHLDTLTDEVVARSRGEWEEDIARQEVVSNHMWHFAEVLTPGLVPPS